MSYNEWLETYPNGTPKQYMVACEQNGWAVNFRDANLYRANLRYADLRSTDLRDANLSSAELRGAYMRSADMRDACMVDANLSSADLRSADLRDANLRYADLEGVTMNWISPKLISERLRQAAGEVSDRRVFAVSIVANRDHCWDWFIENTPANMREWALEIMRTWVKEGDNLPKELVWALDNNNDGEETT